MLSTFSAVDFDFVQGGHGNGDAIGVVAFGDGAAAVLDAEFFFLAGVEHLIDLHPVVAVVEGVGAIGAERKFLGIELACAGAHFLIALFGDFAGGGVADSFGFVVVDIVFEAAEDFDHFPGGIDFDLGVVDDRARRRRKYFAGR
jgi:hypothetical protein